MAKKINCARCDTQWEDTSLICPNCENKSLSHFSNNAHFRCYKCGENWVKVPCPSCGTGLLASAVKDGCYVATCIYGSYDCSEVWMLRRYRDNVLANTWTGTKFISMYYAISPTIVWLFGKQEWFHKICKPWVDSIVVKLRKSGIDDSPYSDN